ncbi:hypothetical protein AYX15_00411 [Cryptococcus neoformans]|nr:hypothetical protein AYX15_00411 [Cryptococcus neoformans var. grubii]
MLSVFSSRYTRYSPLLLLFLLGSTFLLFERSSSASSTLPRSSIYDYTSPATHCFWPQTDASDESAATSQSKISANKGNVGKMKEWIGWGDSEEVDEDVSSDEGFAWEGQLPDVVPVRGIERYMLAHLEELQQGYDAKHDYEEYGLKIGNISLSAYTAELLETYKEYLLPPDTPRPNPPPSFLPTVLSRLSLRPPIAPLPPRPDQVMTTEKSVDDLPWQFQRWKEIMPEWEIKYYDDKALVNWVRGMFGGTKAEKIWKNLPRQVLKTDVFRYMAMLVEGGIYTDSDTAPIIHADQWGHPYNHHTSPLLTHLSRILSISTSLHLPSSHPLSSFSPDHAGTTIDEELDVDVSTGKSTIYDGPLVDDGAELGQPSLVVSVESDAIDFGWHNWREVGLSRAVQITQWTFMARPGHPVFLDALGRTLRKSEEMARKEKEAKKNGEEFIPETALEWTGPGVFSDCVYRYLISRYGFKPDDLIHKKDPLRVGDVLILPAGSFSSVSPFGDEQQRNWAASWHGFFGRWRGADPGVQEFERLKKLKKEAEEAEKKAKEEAEEAEKKAKEAEQQAKEASEQADKSAQEAEEKAKEAAEEAGRKAQEASDKVEALGEEVEKAKELAEGKSDGQDGDSGEFTESREETEEGMLA